MQAAQLTIATSTVGQLDSSSLREGSRFGSSSVMDSSSLTGTTSSFTGRIGSLVARVFGCRHADMSRPFSRDGRAYRSCLNCGAQRQFNLGNWQTHGRFYYGQPQTRQIPTA